MLDGGVALAAAVVLMLAVGLSLGLLGSGGSIITLPVLVYVARLPVAAAVASSLVIVGVTAAAGAVVQGRRSGLDAKAALVFALTGAVGAYAGAHLTPLVSDAVLMLIFGALMVAAGLRMRVPRALRRDPAQGRRMAVCAAAGLSVGVLTGFLGIGGGFLILPALVLFAGTDMRRAVPTSLCVIAANCMGGLVGQSRQIDLPLAETATFLAAALGGMWAGTAVAVRLSSHALQRVFAYLVLAVGTVIIVRHVYPWL